LEGSSSVGVRNFNSGQFTTFYADTVIVGTQASGGVNIVTGTGDPENNVAAPQGSLFLRRDGAAATTLYVKTSGGTGNTGWTAK
jgi:hypothetical protein